MRRLRPSPNGHLIAATIFFSLGWLANIAGCVRLTFLDFSRFGTDLDIPERLAIEATQARCFLPFLLTAIGFHTFSAFFLFNKEAYRFWPLLWQVTLGLLWLVTTTLLALQLFFNRIFAG
jgi:hypothetical protein